MPRMIAGLVSKIDQVVEKNKKLEGEYLKHKEW